MSKFNSGVELGPMPAIMKKPNPLKQSFDGYLSRPHGLGKLNISKSLNNIKSFQFSKFKNNASELTDENPLSLEPKEDTIQIRYQNVNKHGSFDNISQTIHQITSSKDHIKHQKKRRHQTMGFKHSKEMEIQELEKISVQQLEMERKNQLKNDEIDIEVASLKSKQKAYYNYKKQITLDSKFKS